jgi:hypothetical protein
MNLGAVVFGTGFECVTHVRALRAAGCMAPEAQPKAT